MTGPVTWSSNIRILLARSRVVEARIQAAALTRACLILLVRSLVAARIQAAVLLILLVRSLVEANIPAAVLLILLARIRVVARIPAQRERPAATRILLLQVTGPVMARVMRLRRSAWRMRHKGISQDNGPALPQPTISTRMPRTAISMPTSGVGMLQIV